MARFLLFLAVVGVGVWLFRQRRHLSQFIEKQQPPPPPPSTPELMVTCAHCQTQLPKTEALSFQEHYYCCEAHRSANQPKN